MGEWEQERASAKSKDLGQSIQVLLSNSRVIILTILIERRNAFFEHKDKSTKLDCKNAFTCNYCEILAKSYSNCLKIFTAGQFHL